jgi:hypothetical protein
MRRRVSHFSPGIGEAGIAIVMVLAGVAANDPFDGIVRGLLEGGALPRRLRVFNGLRVPLVVLAIAAGYMTFRTGGLGAKEVWQGRIQAAHHGAPRAPA